VLSENSGDLLQRDAVELDMGGGGEEEVGGNVNEAVSIPSSTITTENLGDREVDGNIADAVLTSNENLGDEEVGRNVDEANSTTRSRTSSMTSLSALSELGGQSVVGVESEQDLSDKMEVDGSSSDNSSDSPESVNDVNDLDSSVHLEAPFELRRSTRNANPQKQPIAEAAMPSKSTSFKKKQARNKDKNLLLVRVLINSTGTVAKSR
jgi:hypothetical protein